MKYGLLRHREQVISVDAAVITQLVEFAEATREDHYTTLWIGSWVQHVVAF